MEYNTKLGIISRFRLPRGPQEAPDNPQEAPKRPSRAPRQPKITPNLQQHAARRTHPTLKYAASLVSFASSALISMGAPAFPPRHGASLAPQSLVVHMLHDVNMRLHPTASATADQLCMGVAGDAPQALSIRPPLGRPCQDVVWPRICLSTNDFVSPGALRIPPGLAAPPLAAQVRPNCLQDRPQTG